MAFDPTKFAYGPWLCSYLSTTDTMIEISETGYFDLLNDATLAQMIIIKSSDNDAGIYKVTQVTPPVTIAKI